MAKKGQTLSNQLTGDIFEFLETSEDTNGERVTIKLTVKSKGMLVPDHVHILQDEKCEVISGKLTYMLEGKQNTLQQGQTITLPKLKSHNHFNNDDSPLVYIHTATPALDFEYLIENIVGLSSDGKMKNGKAGFIQELVTLKYLDSKTYLADVPIGIQKVLMNIIAPVARLFGYRAIYKKYTNGIEK